MNVYELQHALNLAARIEAEAVGLYSDFAHLSDDSRERQFWKLLSFEEATHSHIMDLVARNLEPSYDVPEDRVPGPLRHDMQGLRDFYSWLRGQRRTWQRLGTDQMAMVRTALEIENSEADRVLQWLMMLPVNDATRQLIRQLVRGTTDHEERVMKHGEALLQKAP